ncbi:unnamed protein product [Prorocentrum cordatum]|uniref:Ubiquitinyl hydrolase 1 n=1 Tax=Prorocentrum cordatum TaxID=2364126 RepID=A0ABN9VQL3_9DINO|nr:unnamed protein product [Polarella glacialis]
MEGQQARPAGFMGGAAATPPPGPAAKSVLGSTGASLATPRGGSAARAAPRPVVDHEVDPPDPGVEALAQLEARFYPSAVAREKVLGERRAYPRKVGARKPATGPLAKDAGGAEEPVQMRVPGLGLAAQRLLKSTSIKLPVSAYPLYVEMSGPHGDLWHRRFNGGSTISDLKRWVFEKLLLPDFTYDLSYAEPGKAVLEDDLRLLTLDEALETRNFATVRGASDELKKGVPGVHSVGTVDSTNLYVRVKCMHCGNLLNSLAPSRKFKTFVDSSELQREQRAGTVDKVSSSTKIQGASSFPDPADIGDIVEAAMDKGAAAEDMLAGLWVRPDESKHCFYHTKGYELFKVARESGKGGHSYLAKISINNQNFPSLIEKPLAGLRGSEQQKQKALH